MKTLVVTSVIAISFAFSVPVMAQMNHGGMSGGMSGGSTSGGMSGGSTSGGGMSGGTTQGRPAAMAAQHGADAAMGEGLVKKVDKTRGTVTLAHGAMNGMPAMTMAYKVKDVTWLDTLKAGQKIRFATDPADGGMTVTQIETLK
jgi:Cu/Ag efflux protein CusF